MKIFYKLTVIFFLFTNICNADLIKPSSNLKPIDVLIIQLNSLKNNNSPYKDAGIEQVWEFAHPNNKAITGPLNKFKQMIYSQSYNLLISHENSEIQVLNEAKNACINPIPTCTFPDVLNNAQDACINTFDKVSWIDRRDTCQGVRPISSLSSSTQVFILKANTNVRNDSPQIPEGYRWITHQEYTSLVYRNNAKLNYHGSCGYSAYSNINGNNQYEISFSNTAATGQRTHSGTYEGHLHTSWNYPNNWLGIAVVRDN